MHAYIHTYIHRYTDVFVRTYICYLALRCIIALGISLGCIAYTQTCMYVVDTALHSHICHIIRDLSIGIVRAMVN